MPKVIVPIQINYRVQRQVAAIGALNAALADWLRQREVPEQSIGAVQVVMDELVGNLQRHDPDRDDPLEVELRLDSDVLKLLLRYQSDDFDPKRKRDVDVATPISQRRIGGLGLHLIHGLMDDVQYEYRDGMICLRMQKHVHAVAADAHRSIEDSAR